MENENDNDFRTEEFEYFPIDPEPAVLIATNRDHLLEELWSVMENENKRKESLDFLNGTLEKVGEIPEEDACFLRLECGCGKKYKYEEEWNIPHESVQCECGMFVIKYVNPMDGV